MTPTELIQSVANETMEHLERQYELLSKVDTATQNDDKVDKVADMWKEGFVLETVRRMLDEAERRAIRSWGTSSK